MESHLVERIKLEQLQLFEQRTLPLRLFPNHVFQSRKKGSVGKKQVHDQIVLKERTLNVPLNDRGTYPQSPTDNLKVSKHLIHNLAKEGVLSVHSSAIKPYLTDENKKEGFKWCLEKLDLDAGIMD
jgi:hypothetical protein